MKSKMHRIKNFRILIFQICIVSIAFYVMNYALYFLSPAEKALLNLTSFCISFLMSLAVYYKHKNIFIPTVLGCYIFACIIEIQSKLYTYTDVSHDLWSIGNVLILIGFSYELIKICRIKL